LTAHHGSPLAGSIASPAQFLSPAAKIFPFPPSGGNSSTSARFVSCAQPAPSPCCASHAGSGGDFGMFSASLVLDPTATNMRFPSGEKAMSRVQCPDPLSLSGSTSVCGGPLASTSPLRYGNRTIDCVLPT
jgi:hypothetical protein